VSHAKENARSLFRHDTKTPFGYHQLSKGTCDFHQWVLSCDAWCCTSMLALMGGFSAMQAQHQGRKTVAVQQMQQPQRDLEAWQNEEVVQLHDKGLLLHADALSCGVLDSAVKCRYSKSLGGLPVLRRENITAQRPNLPMWLRQCLQQLHLRSLHTRDQNFLCSGSYVTVSLILFRGCTNRMHDVHMFAEGHCEASILHLP
jgi:hypothetical protein